MSRIITPTVGRAILLYVKNPTAGIPVMKGEPLAATIAAVHGDNYIAIGFLDGIGRHHSMDSVPIQQEGEADPGGDFVCRWMPYQLDVAGGQVAATHHQVARADGSNPTSGHLTPRADANAITGNEQATHDQAASGMTEGARLLLNPGPGNPTTGGLTPRSDVLPAPAVQKAKQTVAAEQVKQADAAQARAKAIKPGPAVPAKKVKGAVAKAVPAKKAPAKKAAAKKAVKRR